MIIEEGAQMWLEKCELEVLYSSGTLSDRKVITVFVGGSEYPLSQAVRNGTGDGPGN